MERSALTAGILQKWAVHFKGVRETVDHLYDLLRLLPLVDHVHLSSAISLVISDVDGQLGGLQLLVAVALTAAPHVNVLRKDGKRFHSKLKRRREKNARFWQSQLTRPRSMMKQSPLLKLDQDRSTCFALMALRPLTCSRRFTFASLVTTC